MDLWVFFYIQSTCPTRTARSPNRMSSFALTLHAYADFLLFFFCLGVIFLFFSR